MLINMIPFSLFRLPVICAVAALALSSTAGAVPGATPKIESFPRTEVRLTPSRWLDAEKRDGAYLLSLEPDRLLYAFRVTAGLPSPGTSYGGWEAANGELRGHIVGGHYLSALALMYASTGDVRFKQRGELMVRELGKCQAASGYLSAFPESFFDRVENDQPVWAPYYTVHKIFAGLLDQYELCGNANALEMATKLAFYFERRNAPFDAAKMRAVLNNEAGGFGESLWNLYGITKDPRIRALAEKFEKAVFIEPLMRSEDQLTGLHGNTHIPLVLAAMRRYELTGEKRYLDLTEYFWGRVVGERSWATGGTTGPGENWGEAGKLSVIMSLTTHETCKTYNLLRLARKLFEATGDYRYADYYSHAHLNGILGTEGPEPGQFEYYTPMATGYHRWFGYPDKSMWCCTGSGMENFAKLGDSIFFHTDDTLTINQFIPCVLNWKERGFQLAIETQYPEEETVHFVVQSDSAPLTLRILQPSWAGQGVTVRVNDKSIPLKVENGFIVIAQSWKAGDRISLNLPMSLRTVPLPDDPQQVAIAYGPVVLAGIVERPKESAFMTIGAGSPQPESEAKKKAYYFVSDRPDHLAWLKPVDGKPLHFQTIGQPLDFEFQPFYSVTSERYGIYWSIVTRGSERQRKLDNENGVLELLRTMESYQSGDSLPAIELAYDRHMADPAQEGYHKQLRLSMAKLYMNIGRQKKSLEVIQPLVSPFIGKRDSSKIIALTGEGIESNEVRPLLFDQIDPSGGDASADREVMKGTPVIITKSLRNRFVYFAFTPTARAALAKKKIRIRMKYDSTSVPVLQYNSTRGLYEQVKPTKIETQDGWQIATFECSSARFSGGQNHGADLRVASEDGAILAVADLKAEWGK
jgi:DUF1680 family protein